MAPSTRRKTSTTTPSTSKKSLEAALASTSSTAPKAVLKPSDLNPPKLLILPKNTSAGARIVTLTHARTGKGTRYFVCPENGEVYEFTQVKGAEGKRKPRSWLLTPPPPPSGQPENHGQKENETQKETTTTQEKKPPKDKGYITQSPTLYIATPIDPLFLILPILSPPSSSSSNKPKQTHYLPLDGHIDTLTTHSPHLSTFLLHPATSPLYKALTSRIIAVCDSVPAGDEDMYRLSLPKLLSELLSKAERMVAQGLPASLEERFVKRALEVPILGHRLQRGQSGIVVDDEEMEEERKEEKADVSAAAAPEPTNTSASGTNTPAESQDSIISTSSTSSIATDASTVSSSTTSTAATSTTSQDGSDSTTTTTSIEETPKSKTENSDETSPQIIHLLRLRTALSFIFTSYLPPSLAQDLDSLLSTSASKIDFSPLTSHLSHLTSLRAAAAASHSLTNNFSLKRNRDSFEEDETRAEKKRKKEEEEKKKRAGESRGVRELKKVNTKGMRKIGDFFGKK